MSSLERKNKEKIKFLLGGMGIATCTFISPCIFGYSVGFYEKTAFDKDVISIILQFTGVIISALLTWLIIRQTNKISKDQLAFEKQNAELAHEIAKNQSKIDEENAKRQEELIQHQIKIDLYSHRVQIFKNLRNISAYTHLLYDTEKINAAASEKALELINIEDALKSAGYKNDEKLDVSSAIFLFKEPLVQIIQDIEKKFADINSQLAIMTQYKRVYPEDYAKLIILYNNIINICTGILKYDPDIYMHSQIECDIAGLERK